jgi:hypothetical protein
LQPSASPRPIGTGKGDFVGAADFNDPLPKEIEDTFYKVDDLLEESFGTGSISKRQSEH